MRYSGGISLLITDEGASQNQNEGAEGSVKKKKKKKKRRRLLSQRCTMVV